MNKATPSIVAALVALAVGFYGGMQYGQSVAPQANPQQQAGAPSDRFPGGMGRRGGAGQNGGFTGGEVIAKDGTSIIVKLRDPRQSTSTDAQGGSKIVFVSSSTAVMKSVEGSLSDVAVGEQVTVSGSANPDGSITAQSIQIRPMPKTTNNQ